jgi:hypothetical protein
MAWRNQEPTLLLFAALKTMQNKRSRDRESKLSHHTGSCPDLLSCICSSCLSKALENIRKGEASFLRMTPPAGGVWQDIGHPKIKMTFQKNEHR